MNLTDERQLLSCQIMRKHLIGKRRPGFGGLRGIAKLAQVANFQVANFQGEDDWIKAQSTVRAMMIFFATTTTGTDFSRGYQQK